MISARVASIPSLWKYVTASSGEKAESASSRQPLSSLPSALSKTRGHRRVVIKTLELHARAAQAAQEGFRQRGGAIALGWVNVGVLVIALQRGIHPTVLTQQALEAVQHDQDVRPAHRFQQIIDLLPRGLFDLHAEMFQRLGQKTLKARFLFIERPPDRRLPLLAVNAC